MPLIFEKQISATKKTGVWEITETPDFFESETDNTVFHSKNPKRRLERLVCSHLLTVLTGKSGRGRLMYDEYGKPYISDNSYSVSFSHSGKLIACIIGAANEDVGIDIEYQRANIALLSNKFRNSDDSAPLAGDIGLQMIWGAKEVLYKIHGKKSLDFKEHLHIRSIPEFYGFILLNGRKKSFRLDYTRIHQYLLIWNV